MKTSVKNSTSLMCGQTPPKPKAKNAFQGGHKVESDGALVSTKAPLSTTNENKPLANQVMEVAPISIRDAINKYHLGAEHDANK